MIFSEDVVGLLVVFSAIIGAILGGARLYGDGGIAARRAYIRGLRHGLAQATLPPYLQNLSNGTPAKVS